MSGTARLHTSGDLDRSLDGKFRVSVVATGLEGSPLPASAPHAAE
ncbi:hypothetical protein [Rhizobium leguminosarum]|nr:hypothetical protein [Rhizobium leguminosarum]